MIYHNSRILSSLRRSLENSLVMGHILSSHVMISSSSHRSRSLSVPRRSTVSMMQLLLISPRFLLMLMISWRYSTQLISSLGTISHMMKRSSLMSCSDLVVSENTHRWVLSVRCDPPLITVSYRDEDFPSNHRSSPNSIDSSSMSTSSERMMRW